MRKIRLELEALSVESFAPAETPGARGTVHGHASLYWEDCALSETCQGAGWPCGPSEQSCGGSCYEYTCHPGCAGTGGGGGSHPGLGVPCSATCNDEDGW
jgi:hypothetical protein